MNKNRGKTIDKIRMGSRPFLYGIELYSDRMSAYMSATTIEENTRKLRYFAGILLQMKKSGTIKTTDPRHIGTLEIEMFAGHMRRKGLSPVTRRSYLKVLNGYLNFFGNDIIDRMKHNGSLSLILKGQQNPVRYLEQDELQKIFDAADNMEGYEGVLLRGFFSIIFSIAGRPKEIIRMRCDDIDLHNNLIYIRHPKGEGSYGTAQWISIVREDMIPRIRAFLEERSAYLKVRGIDSPFLFVSMNSCVPLTLKSIRVYKHNIEKITGISFQLKDFRSSFATITYASAPDLKDAISKQMRHSSTSITERYYIAYDEKMAAKSLQNEWKKSKILPKK